MITVFIWLHGYATRFDLSFQFARKWTFRAGCEIFEETEFRGTSLIRFNLTYPTYPFCFVTIDPPDGHVGIALTANDGN